MPSEARQWAVSQGLSRLTSYDQFVLRGLARLIDHKKVDVSYVIYV